MSLNIGTRYSGRRPAPAAGWVDLDSHAHTVQFYGDDSFLLDELSRYVGSALGAGDASVVIATRAHREGLARRLKARGLDISLASRQGRYVSLDAAGTLSKFMRDGRPDQARFGEVVGGAIASAALEARGEFPRVVAFGEMVALLWAEGKAEAALELEQMWNDLAQVHSFELRCAYPINLFSSGSDGELIGKICGAHSHVVPAEGYTSLATDNERSREVAFLQQKAQALQTEIEERKKVEQALSEINRELRQAVDARDEFMSVAAHELKTPLTSLRGVAQLLLRDIQRGREISPQRVDFAVQTLERQTGRLTQLVTRLLDSTQIEAGRLRVEPVPTDLVALARSALAEQHAGAGHKLVFEGPEHLEAMVDPVRFEQVITNLLDNAVKFSPGGGTVTLAMERAGDGGVRLSVTDEGIGIPAGQREAIFERFQQAHGAHHLSGMGLGLYIAREIVSLHGGDIHIEDPGHPGARFVVSLPGAQ
jgi:signal transduction histidine kinase